MLDVDAHQERFNVKTQTNLYVDFRVKMYVGDRVARTSLVDTRKMMPGRTPDKLFETTCESQVCNFAPSVGHTYRYYDDNMTMHACAAIAIIFFLCHICYLRPSKTFVPLPFLVV